MSTINSLGYGIPMRAIEDEMKDFFIFIKENHVSDIALYHLGSYCPNSATDATGQDSESFLPGYVTDTFAAYSMEDRRRAVKLYISHVMDEFLDRVVISCLEVFYPLIHSTLLSAKQVCDELLISHDDIMRNPTFFKEAVAVMDRLVRQMDYKGCRDLFGRVLGLYKTFTEGEEKVFVPAFKLISTLMDRSLCLMPAYFALHEVTKLPPVEHTHLHPILRKKLQTFRDSFKNVASMFAHKVIRQVVPIAGVGNYSLPPATLQHPQPSSITNMPVNLLASNGVLDLKGPLPYARSLQRPHTSLIRAMLTQQGSMDLLLCLLSLHTAPRASKISRCLFLERCLIDTILWTVDQTETCESDNDSAWADTMWRHLGLYSIHLCRLHLVRFPELCLGILEGLQDRRSTPVRSAPHIAWLLFNFFGAQNKNPLGDFAPILRILDLLYPGDAPAFDTTLLVWLSLTQKSSASNERLPRALPPPMQPMMSELTEKFQQMSQSPGYQVPLEPEEFRWFAYVYNAYAPLGQPQVVSPLNSRLVEALKRPDAVALPYESLRQLATMSLIAINTLLHSLLSAQTDSPVVLETFARATVLIHHDLNLQSKSVLTDSFKSSSAANSKLFAFIVELATFHLNSVDPMQRQLLLHNLVTLSKSNRLNLDAELCLYRQVQALLTPALQITTNHVKKLYVSWICSSDQEELNKYLLLQVSHQLVQQQADPDGAWLSDFVQPLFQKCSAACQVPNSMRPHLPANAERISVPSADRQSQQLAASADLASRLCQRVLQEGQCDEAQLSEQSSGCLYWVALTCLRERGGDLPAAQLFARVNEALGWRGTLPHLRVFCDLLTREVASAPSPAAEASVLHHVTGLVYSHRLIPLHRLLLVLLLRPFPDRRLELALFRVLQHLLSAATPNSPMAVIVPVLNRFAPCGGASGSLSSLVTQLRAVYDDSSSNSSSLYSHMAIRVSMVMDTALARLAQLQPPESRELLCVTLAPFLRHMPAPGTCLITLLSVYNPPAVLQLHLTASLLTPRIEASPAGSYLPADCLPVLKSVSSRVDTDERLAEQLAQRVGPAGAVLKRLSTALSSHGRLGFPQLDWVGQEWPACLAHAVNCCSLQLLLCATEELASPIIPPPPPPVDEDRDGSKYGGGGAAKKARLFESSEADFEPEAEEADEPEDEADDEVDKADWQCAGVLLAQLPARLTNRLVQQPLLNLYDSLAGAPPARALGRELAGRPEVCLWFAYLSHSGPGRIAQLPAFFRHSVRAKVRCEAQLLLSCQLVGPLFADLLRAHNSVQNELVAELYHCLAEVDAISCGRLEQQDALADYFYHIKYMFVGDGVRKLASSVIDRLSPSMQCRLKSIAPGHQPDGQADAPNFPAQSET